MSTATELAALFLRDLTRVAQQTSAFGNDEDLWRMAPGMTNTPGNLVLHLEGNLREFIGRQLGGIPYERRRPEEFSERGISGAELRLRIVSAAGVVSRVLGALPDDDLDKTYPENVLGTPLTTRQFLMHLLGHLNYHLGQIDVSRRILTGRGAIELAGL